MYRDSSERLRMMDYCNGVDDFISYALSNLKNINGDGIDVHLREVRLKSFLIYML